MLLAISLSLFSLRSTRQLMSTEHLWQRKKTPSSNFEEQTWPFLFLLFSTHIRLVWEKKENLKKKKSKKYFLCREGLKNVLFSHSQASTFIASTFILLYIISDSEFSIFYWYSLEGVTILKVLLQNWVFCLDVCKFRSAYATCTLQIGISICKNGDYMCTCKFSELINQECTKTTNALLKFGSK